MGDFVKYETATALGRSYGHPRKGRAKLYRF